MVTANVERNSNAFRTHYHLSPIYIIYYNMISPSQVSYPKTTLEMQKQRAVSWFSWDISVSLILVFPPSFTASSRSATFISTKVLRAKSVFWSVWDHFSNYIKRTRQKSGEMDGSQFASMNVPSNLHPKKTDFDSAILHCRLVGRGGLWTRQGSALQTPWKRAVSKRFRSKSFEIHHLPPASPKLKVKNLWDIRQTPAQRSFLTLIWRESIIQCVTWWNHCFNACQHLTSIMGHVSESHTESQFSKQHFGHVASSIIPFSLSGRRIHYAVDL